MPLQSYPLITTAEFEKSIHNWDAYANARFFQKAELLEESGPTLTMPLARPLCEGMKELRYNGKKVRYRVIYFVDCLGNVVLLYGFIKKEKKTLRTHIHAARLAKQKYLNNQA